MTSIQRPVFLGVFTCLSLLAHAETIVLKDGNKLEGRVLEETASDYLLEIQVTPSIKDQRRIAKADVRSVSLPDPAADAHADILKSLPLPDHSSVDAYDALLDTKILPFLTTYPKSPKLAEVKQIRDDLTAERNLIAAGGVRLNGSLYSGADREANAFDIDALLAANDIRAKGQRGEFTQALRAFQLFERDFATSPHYRETAQFADRILTSFRDAIQQDLDQYESRLANRQRGLERIPIEDRRRSEYLIEEEGKAYLALLEREKAAGIQWPTLNAYHPEPMRAMLVTIATQRTRLQGVKFDELPDGGKAFRDAWRSACNPSAGDELKTSVAAMKTAKVPDRYIERVVQRAAETKAANPVALPATDPAADPATTPVTPATTPVTPATTPAAPATPATPAAPAAPTAPAAGAAGN